MSKLTFIEISNAFNDKKGQFYKCPACSHYEMSIKQTDKGFVYTCNRKNNCGVSGGVFSKVNSNTTYVPNTLENEVIKYHNATNKYHRLTNDIIKEFKISLFNHKYQKGDKEVSYNSITLLDDNNYPLKNLIIRKDAKPIWQAISNSSKEKSKLHWFNINRTFDHIKSNQDNDLFIVAGEWDVMSLWKNASIHGITNVYGESKKTNYHIDEIKFLLKPNINIIIIYDNDDAGRIGQESLRRALLKYDRNLKILSIDTRTFIESDNSNTKQDIDDYFSNGGTKEKFLECINLEKLKLLNSQNAIVPIINSDTEKDEVINSLKNIFKDFELKNDYPLWFDNSSQYFNDRYKYLYFISWYYILELESVRKEVFEKVTYLLYPEMLNTYNEKDNVNDILDSAYKKIVFDLADLIEIHNQIKLKNIIADYNIVRRVFEDTHDYLCNTYYFFNGKCYEILSKRFIDDIIISIIDKTFKTSNSSLYLSKIKQYNTIFESMLSSGKAIDFEKQKYKQKFKTFKNGTLLLQDYATYDNDSISLGEFYKDVFFKDYYALSYIDIEYTPINSILELNEASKEFLKAISTWFKHDIITEYTSKISGGVYEAGSITKEFLKALYYLIALPKNEQVFLFFYGHILQGQNAKGEASSLFKGLAGLNSTSTLTLDALEKDFMLQLLRDKTLNICDEVDKGKPIEKNGLFKTLTSNNHIAVDIKHKDPVIMKPDCLWLILSNEPMPTNDASSGMLRRIKPITFSPIPDEDRQRDYYNNFLKPTLNAIIQYVLFYGSIYWRHDQGFSESVDDVKIKNDMLSNNSVFEYWNHSYTQLMNDDADNPIKTKDYKINMIKYFIVDEIEKNTTITQSSKYFKYKDKIGFINVSAHYNEYKKYNADNYGAKAFVVSKQRFKRDTIGYFAREFKNIINLNSNDAYIKVVTSYADASNTFSTTGKECIERCVTYTIINNENTITEDNYETM